MSLRVPVVGGSEVAAPIHTDCVSPHKNHELMHSTASELLVKSKTYDGFWSHAHALSPSARRTQPHTHVLVLYLTPLDSMCLEAGDRREIFSDPRLNYLKSTSSSIVESHRQGDISKQITS